jgi:predicted RNase H-like nuclease (RuvC/YqgF family)
MSFNRTDLDNYITGHYGEDQFDWLDAEEDEMDSGEESTDSMEKRYARSRSVGILELMDNLKMRDERISQLEQDMRTLRGFVAHALRMAGDNEDAAGLDEVNRQSWPGRTVER